MRSQEEIQKELDRIKIAHEISETVDDNTTLYHIKSILNWILYKGGSPPSGYSFDDKAKFQAAWKPERRVKRRRELSKYHDRRINPDRRSL